MNEALKKQGKIHCMAHKVIAEVLHGIAPHTTEERRTRYAVAIIARLAAHDPPLLICAEDEMKDEAVAVDLD